MRSIWPAMALGAAIAVSLPARAQDIGSNPDALTPLVELPPRYRVEFIIFAHNRFDSGEEYFGIVPPESRFAAGDEPIPLRYFDADDRLALRELVEGPISPPPIEEPTAEDGILPGDPDASSDESQADGEVVLEAFLDPALVDGPATRYLGLDELTLYPELDRLERLDAYTPLVHSGWEQNGLAEADAVPVDMAEFGSDNPRGTIQLHMSRYLHIAVDLVYRDVPLTFEARPLGNAPVYSDSPLRPGSPGSPSAYGSVLPEGPEYYLFEQRRILRGELNYFDHPAFGLLLVITLAPEAESDSAVTTDGPSA